MASAQAGEDPARPGGTEPKSWSNALSDASAALKHFELVESPRNHQSDLSPPWLALWRDLRGSKDNSMQLAVTRFLYFLNRHGIDAQEVHDEHAEAYRQSLARNAISKNPEVSWRAAVNGWNLAARRLPNWPQQRLSLPNRQKRIALPLEDFPLSFQVEFRLYIDSLTTPDPFADRGRLIALRPETVKQYRLRLLRFASVLVHAGLEVGAITDLNVVIAPENVKRGLRWMLARNDGKTSRNIDQTASLLKEIARNYLQISEDKVAELVRFSKRVSCEQQIGMTLKNRARLRPFCDPGILRRFVRLPDLLFDRAGALGDSYTAHLMRETGVAIAILLHCPIRKSNLASVHLERNIVRPGDGRAFLVFTPDAVKNDRPIEFELPQSVLRKIDDHLARRSPVLCPPATPWLFPKRDGSKSIDVNQLSSNVIKAIRRDVGIEFNMHLFRHLAAKLWLDANPGQYEVVRRLLGHSALSKTINAYAGFEAGTAARLFSDVVDRAGRA